MGAVRWLKVGVLVVALALALGACGKSKSKAASSGSGTTVEGYDFRFDPKALNVKTGQKVTLTFKNLTRKTSFTKTLTMAAPDVSSAEWIAEAPSACDTYGRCRQVTLTNFGKITFTKALATAGGHTGTVSDSLWTATPIELQSFADFGPFASASASAGAQAVPASLSTDGSAFTVTYSELDTPQTAVPDPYGPGGGAF